MVVDTGPGSVSGNGPLTQNLVPTPRTPPCCPGGIPAGFFWTPRCSASWIDISDDREIECHCSCPDNDVADALHQPPIRVERFEKSKARNRVRQLETDPGDARPVGTIAAGLRRVCDVEADDPESGVAGGPSPTSPGSAHPQRR